jgi:type IV pilus assembly protein PilV
MSINRSAGFTIIEVLVAVLVLAFGVMGSAAMQLAALRARHQSSLLSNAVQLGSSMLDAMCANASQMRLSDVDNPYLGLDYDALMPAASAQSCFAGAHCDNAQLAAFDIAQWQRQLKSSVPGGRFVICRDDQPSGGAGSTAWACSGAPTAPIVIKLGWSAADGTAGQAGGPQVRQVMLVLRLTGGAS